MCGCICNNGVFFQGIHRLAEGLDRLLLRIGIPGICSAMCFVSGVDSNIEMHNGIKLGDFGWGDTVQTALICICVWVERTVNTREGF